MKSLAALTAVGMAVVALLSGSPATAAAGTTTAPYVLQHQADGWSKSRKPRTIRPGHGFSLRHLRWRTNSVAHGWLEDSAGVSRVVIHMSHTRSSHGVRYYGVFEYQTRLMGDFMRWSWHARQWEFCYQACA